jgi:glycosyltransferase involved in cell wall biosynthesis
MTHTPGVLIVDQGASFGGSALVAAVLANRMPMERYRVHLVAATTPDVLRLTPASRPRVATVAKAYDYVEQSRTRDRLSRLPSPIRRLGGWGDTVLRMFRNRAYIRAVVAWIRREKIQLVHLNNGFENLEAHLAAWLTGTPVVVHAHGPCGRSYLTRQLAPRAPTCIAISQSVAESCRAAGVSAQRLRLVPNPLTVRPTLLDLGERQRARARYGIPEDFTTAGIVGRIVSWKGQLEFLRAAAIALRQVPDAGAVIIGDVTDANDAYGRKLRQEVVELGIEDRVWFTGFIQDPIEAYALIDVLVHSSILPEPFGLVLTEAMAFGIPVIAAVTGGPVEIITEGLDGFLRDPRDPAAVGTELARLLRDASLRSRIGAAGQDTVIRRFDPDNYVSRMAEIYDQVLGETGSERRGK